MAAGLKAAKAALRKEMRSRLAAISPADKVRQSKKVAEQVLADPVYRRARSISIFLSMADEIETEPILQDALRSGKACFVPMYYRADRTMDMVMLKGAEDLESLPLTEWNVKQPAEEDRAGRAEAMEWAGGLDLMFVPGVAFTKDGRRLGRGKGYYDVYLAKIFAASIRPPHTVALAFDEQVVEDVPVGEADFLVDRVVSGGSSGDGYPGQSNPLG